MKEKVANEMQELIKINVNEKGQQLVSARELHFKLRLSKRFSSWIKQYVKEDNDYLFEDGIDFTTVPTSTLVNNGAVRELNDYAITIDMAKEICMVTKNVEGKKLRKYFIECEKKLKAMSIKQDSYMIKDPIARAKAWIEEEQQRQLLVAQIEKDKPKVQFFDAVAGSKDSIEMGQVAKVLGVKGLGRNKLFELLRKNKVLQRDNIPYQKYVDAGYFRVLEQKFTVPSGETKVNIKTMVFQKGVDYIRKLVQPS